MAERNVCAEVPGVLGDGSVLEVWPGSGLAAAVADEVGELVGSGHYVVGALDSSNQVTWGAGDTDDGTG